MGGKGGVELSGGGGNGGGGVEEAGKILGSSGTVKYEHMRTNNQVQLL